MGLRNFARVHAQAHAADDAVHKLVDLGWDLKDKLDHEHNKRVREKADAKVASNEAKCKAAIDLANMEADAKVAVAEAESRGIARGEAIGYQRAIDETELFNDGFKGGREQARAMAARRQPKNTAFQQQLEAPPASSRGKGPSSDHKGAASTHSSFHRQGAEKFNRPSAHSERSRHPESVYGKNNAPPVSINAGLKKPFVHGSTEGSARSSKSVVKHTQYGNGSEAASPRSMAKSSHSRGSGASKSKHEPGGDIPFSNNFGGGLSHMGLNSQRGTAQAHAYNHGSNHDRPSSRSRSQRHSESQRHSGSQRQNQYGSSASRSRMNPLNGSVYPSSSVSRVSSQRRSQLQRHAETLYGIDEEDIYDDGFVDDEEFFDGGFDDYR